MVDIGVDEFIDTDFDNLPDAWEMRFFGEVGDSGSAQDDYDGDGLTNDEEFMAGINPSEQDTDGDEVNDFIEQKLGFDPNRWDSYNPGQSLGDGSARWRMVP